MSTDYKKFPINIVEVPYRISKKDGTVIEGVRAGFECPKGFPFETVPNAMAFAAFLAHALKTRLNDVLKNNKDEAGRISKTMNWMEKKAKFHPWEMRHVADQIAQLPEFLNELTPLGFSEKEIQKDIRLISVLHDIGRLSEIDLNTVSKFDMSAVKGKGHDHAYESYEILKSIGMTRPEILLPVKYHGLLDFEPEMQKDPMFKDLPETEKKRIVSYTHAVRDADRTSNLLSYTIHGIKKCGEMNDPNYSPVLHPEKYYAVSPICVERLQNGDCCRVNETKTYLDTMLKFVSWSFQMHYDSVKKMVATDVISKIWDRIFEQAADEWNEAPTKDAIKYQATLNQLNETKQIVMTKLDPTYCSVKENKVCDQNKTIPVNQKGVVR